MSTHSFDELESPQPVVRTIEARTHGRYLLRMPAAAPPWPMLVGFHGYGEDASTHLEALSAIEGTRQWLLVSIQALHRFYARQDRVVASWMTRQDREQAITDNIDYVGRVLRHVRSEYDTSSPLVFAGFSQGGAMAYRAAAHYQADGLIVLAADVPPDVVATQRAKLPPVLMGRGVRDEWYSNATLMADVTTLGKMGVALETCIFDGAHEWTDAFRDAAAALLRRTLRTDPRETDRTRHA